MDADRFFMVGIPSLVAKNVARFAKMQGDIAITVRRQGKWTVHLGRVEEPVSRGTSREADLKLWFSPEAFGQFLDGSLPVKDALARRELIFSGDVSLLEKFGYLLSPGGSPLATRFGM